MPSAPNLDRTSNTPLPTRRRSTALTPFGVARRLLGGHGHAAAAAMTWRSRRQHPERDGTVDRTTSLSQDGNALHGRFPASNAACRLLSPDLACRPRRGTPPMRTPI